MSTTLYDLNEVAKKLRVSKRQVQYLIARGRLPYVQVSDFRRMVTEEQLDAYIRAVSVPAESVS